MAIGCPACYFEAFGGPIMASWRSIKEAEGLIICSNCNLESLAPTWELMGLRNGSFLCDCERVIVPEESRQLQTKKNGFRKVCIHCLDSRCSDCGEIAELHLNNAHENPAEHTLWAVCESCGLQEER